MKTLLGLCIVFIGFKANAQLPSEKPFEDLISPAVNQKFIDRKPQKVSHAELPSNAPLPTQATTSNRNTSYLSKATVQHRKLPSATEINWERKQASVRKKQ